jgi:hypothetical protein
MTDHSIAPAPATTTKRSAWDSPLGDILTGGALLLLAAAFVPAMAEHRPFLQFMAMGLVVISIPLNGVAGISAARRDPRDPDQTLGESWKKLTATFSPVGFVLVVAALVSVVVADNVTTGTAGVNSQWVASALLTSLGIRRIILTVRSWHTR